MKKISILVICCIGSIITYTWNYDSLLLNSSIAHQDIFIKTARRHPLFISFCLLSLTLILITITWKKYLSAVFPLSDRKSKMATFLFLPLFCLSFLPFTTTAGLLMIPLYIQMLCCILFVGALSHVMPSGLPWLGRFVGRRFSINTRIFLGGAILLSIFTTSSISFVVFERIPHIEDSISYLFQAHIFSQGRMSVPMPPSPESFTFPNIVMHDNTWYSQYGPGHPLLLAIGILLHIPWLINPLLNTATSLLIYGISKEIYNETVARIAVLLSLFSPFLLFMSSAYMSHPSCLFFICLFLFFFIKTVRSDTWTYPLSAGAALGYAITIRQTTGLLVMLAIIIYSLILTVKRQFSLKKGLLLLTGATLPILFLLFYNDILNGSPFIFRYIPPGTSNATDSLPSLSNYDFGLKNTFTLIPALQRTMERLNLLNIFLFEWPIPSLFFAAIALCGRKRPFELLLFLVPCVISGGYFFREYLEICFGPRYLYETSASYIILSARGINDFYTASSPSLKKHPIAPTLFILLVGFSLFYNLPKLTRIYSNNYFRVGTQLHRAVTEKKITTAVIFIEDTTTDWSKPFFWAEGFQRNSPLLDSDVIYAKNRSAENHKIMTAFPDKDYYVSFFDPVTKKIVIRKITPFTPPL